MKRHIGVVDSALAILASGLLSWIIWQQLDPRAVIFIALGLGLAELFIMMRWRLSIACARCGFDPVLYKKSPEKAASKVKIYIAQRREDPMSAFSPPPKLPVIIKKAEPPRPSASR